MTTPEEHVRRSTDSGGFSATEIFLREGMSDLKKMMGDFIERSDRENEKRDDERKKLHERLTALESLVSWWRWIAACFLAAIVYLIDKVARKLGY